MGVDDKTTDRSSVGDENSVPAPGLARFQYLYGYECDTAVSMHMLPRCRLCREPTKGPLTRYYVVGQHRALHYRRADPTETHRGVWLEVGKVHVGHEVPRDGGMDAKTIPIYLIVPSPLLLE